MAELDSIQSCESGSLDLAAGRRAFLKSVGLGAVAASLTTFAAGEAGAASPELDVAILNFALSLEYLEAEFHLRAAYGVGLADSEVSGLGTLGKVTGGRKIPFLNPVIGAIATEIANNEKNHVLFLRSVLGSRAVARPALNIADSFATAAEAAGIIGPGGTFDPYANDLSFLFAAYNFIDVGVTAYVGAAPVLGSKVYLAAAAGILGCEAYHAGALRSLLFARQDPFANSVTAKLSAAQAKLSGAADAQGVAADQSTLDGGFPSPSNIVPTDPNSLAYSRTPRQVLNVVYGRQNAARGLFFPAGLQAGPGLTALEALQALGAL